MDESRAPPTGGAPLCGREDENYHSETGLALLTGLKGVSFFHCHSELDWLC